ncbi:MAG: hypothetical protein WA005_05520 [Candidatus Binataceae bacterium]
MSVLRSGRLASLILAIGLGLTGCGPIAWTRVTINRPLKPTDVAFIVPGRTKWDEVTKTLGAPNDLVKAPGGGVVADYYYSDSKRFGVNLGWPLGFFPPASYAPHNMDFVNSGTGMDTFQVAFDAGGTVQYDGFSSTAPAARFKASPFEGSPVGNSIP